MSRNFFFDLPVIAKKWLFRLNLTSRSKPPVGAVRLGDLNRTTPFSKKFGYDRGGPIDRYYIERFLEQESGVVQGRVLEIKDNTYSMKYGGSRIAKSEILDIDQDNASATIIADLAHAPELPENTYDCLLITQTLQYIYDFKGALKTCRRILKPGGVLLMTVPDITPIDHKRLGHTWYWSFTRTAMEKVLEETFPDDDVIVESHGNVLAASAFLYGMGATELNPGQLDIQDPDQQVIITVKAVKKE